MSFHNSPVSWKGSRRQWLAGSFAGAWAGSVSLAQGQGSGQPDPDCPRCFGVGRVPLANAKPFVWLKGTPLPKFETALGEQFCPACQSGGDNSKLVTEFNQQFNDALAANKTWEERTGWKLACIITRHAAVHTQLNTTHSKSVGAAIDTLLTYFKQISGSLVLASTQPAEYGLVLLWEKPSWEAFRKVMESQYALEQLGPSWISARELQAYDHFAVPHMYETPQSVKLRPPSCGAVFMVARRQLQLAADWKEPFWLAEGFAAYGDNVVHKINRWFTVYTPKQIPVSDWLANARKLVADAKFRPWMEMMKRELMDWNASDHVQTMSMAAFLFESTPAKFLGYLKLLQGGQPSLAALEEAYRVSLDELEARWSRWLLARR